MAMRLAGCISDALDTRFHMVLIVVAKDLATVTLT